MSKSDDINLVQLLSDSVSFVKKWKWIILFCFTFSIVLLVVKISRNQSGFKPTYTKEFSILSSIVDEEKVINIVNNINNMGGLDTVSPIFKTFRSLSVIPAKPKPKDDVLEKEEFEINVVKLSVDATDNQTIDKLIAEIVGLMDSYLNENPHYKAEYDLLVNQKHELIKLINKEIYALDSTEKNIRNVSDNGALLVNHVNLVEKKLKAEKDLNSIQKIKCVEINKYSSVNSGSRALVFLIVGYSFAGLFFGVVLSWIINLFSKVRNVKQSPF